jgi:Na+/phosphate symporter
MPPIGTAEDRARLRHAVNNQVGIITGYLQLLPFENLSEEDQDSIKEIMAAAQSIRVLLNAFVEGEVPEA